MQTIQVWLLYAAVTVIFCYAVHRFLKAYSGDAQQVQRHSGLKVSQAQDGITSNGIVVVIPALREAAVLPGTIGTLFANASNTAKPSNSSTAPTISVVLVDASGGDGCRACLEPLMSTYSTLHVVAFRGTPSRGAQLNCGALQAKELAPQASVLVFLHADTCLPPLWDKAIINGLASAQQPLTLGCFRLSLPPPISPSLRIMLWGANIRAKWMGLPYGDQCFFMTKRTFEKLGGFPPIPIMEDLEMVRRVSQRGTVKVLDQAVQASPRRWKKKGVFWNTCLNQMFIMAWLSGVSHETIYRWYYGSGEAKTKS